MMFFSSYVLAAICLLCLHVAAHKDHVRGAGRTRRLGGAGVREPLIKRQSATEVSVPLSLNITTSPLSNITIPVPGNKAQYDTALAAYQNLTRIFGFVPDIANSPGGLDALFEGQSCTACRDALRVARAISVGQDPIILNLMAEAYCLATTSQPSFDSCLGYLYTLNPFFAQILQYMDIDGPDGQVFCFTFGSSCPNYVPEIPKGFLTPKPKEVKTVPRSGETINVLHLSDYHLDLRYVVGSEANCTQSLCCHDYRIYGDQFPLKVAAPTTGAYLCDSPHTLGQSVFKSILEEVPDLSFGIFTGDLVSHDLWDLNGSYVLDEELTSYNDFFKGLGPNVPVYPVLGNHDTFPHALNNPPGVFNPALDTFIMNNYAAVGSAWANYSWIDSDTAAYAKSHFGAYTVEIVNGNKIIALQTDWWYYFNYYNYINVANADPSGQLANLVAELQDAEDRGKKVWIIGHVASGDEDVPQGLGPATNLFYQIVDRYAPHVIANIFFGHEHTDNFALYYTNNATEKTAENVVATAWIAQSVTPFTYLNSGWRYYKVDTGSLEIMDSMNYWADISESGTPAWANGPVWQFEYSARDTYGPPGYPADAPLDPVFWHNVSETFLTNTTARAVYNTLQVKKAPTQLGSINPSATNASLQVCAIRAASQPIWLECGIPL